MSAPQCCCHGTIPAAPHPLIISASNVSLGQLILTQCCFALQGTSPVYNLLPDILSALSSEAGLAPAHYQHIMRHLLGFIGKERQVDSLVEKLCLRFEATQASSSSPALCSASQLQAAKQFAQLPEGRCRAVALGKLRYKLQVHILAGSVRLA